MASMAPDWTPATSGYASVSQLKHTESGLGSCDLEPSLDGSLSRVWFRNAHDSLQKRPIANASSLLLVCHIIALTTGGMASDLLRWARRRWLLKSIASPLV
jgi:hypothetical protein